MKSEYGIICNNCMSILDVHQTECSCGTAKAVFKDGVVLLFTDNVPLLDLVNLYKVDGVIKKYSKLPPMSTVKPIFFKTDSFTRLIYTKDTQ